MITRYNANRHPQVTFTSDYHELLVGDLKPGPCVIRYDPLRIVPPGELHDENHHIAAHVRFHPVGGEWHGAMIAPASAPYEQLADPTGDGVMLRTSFDLPPGCEELEVWFSCTHTDGSTHWDSRMGQNFWLRFGLADLAIKQAKVVVAPASAATDALDLRIDSVPAVERLAIRWRLANRPGFPRTETELVATAAANGAKSWSAASGGIAIPKSATVVFDVVYYVSGRKYTDDNQGHWYLAL